MQRPTLEAANDLARRRARRDPDELVAYRGPAGPTMDAALADVGRRLTADFLGGDVGEALAARVAKAEALGELAELGLDVHEELSDLPWETLVVPRPDGAVPDIGATPLVLHHNVAVFRAASGLGPTPAYKVRGPLRILVAIGSPESQDRSGELLNYEAELTRIVRSVEAARRGGSAYVRVLHRGTVSAIRRALAEDPEGFHVLHLSCHAGPGTLVLEDDDGNEDRVSAKRLVEEAVPAGADLPLVVLAGCATGLRGPAEADTEAKLMSFAEALARRGVPQVLAMQAPVSDPYATELAGELYSWLATARDTDVLVALAEARRACERRRQDLPVDAPRRGEPEWATPALLVRGPRLALYHQAEASGPLHAIEQPALAEGIVVRGVGEFVGRRREEREGRLALAGTKAGLVIHGIGGVGKSTLSAELVRSVGPGMVVASKAGALGIDTLLEEVGLRLAAAGRGFEGGEGLVEAAQALRHADVEWAERWDLLTRILGAVPMLVLLDNFEDNLTGEAGTWSVTDPELADLLGRWARNPGKSKLLVTSRHPFGLPDHADRRLAKLHLGPLSPAETSKLMWQLPGLDDLTRDQRARAYRDVGGHPRTLEYLDALLRRGEARFEDVAARMEDRLAEQGIADPQAWLGSPTRDFDANLAEAVTMAVDDVVLGDLLGELSRTPLARELVVGASVYRHPVDETALAWQVATEIEPVPDPAREARMQRVTDAVAAAAKAGNHNPSLEDLRLSATEQADYRADVEAARRPPLDVPDGLPSAMAAAAAAGLLAPLTRGAQAPRWFVHRWTARAVAELEPVAVRASHAKAARFWAWRVARMPQSREEDVEQQIEARFHHHAAGDADAAIALTSPIVSQLQTWGHYGRAAELCRQTLGWVDERSAIAGAMHGRIASLTHLRGDLDLAERGYRQAIELLESAGDEHEAATTYANLAILFEIRGTYDAAEALYHRAIAIQQRTGDEHNLALNYLNLGNLAGRRGDPAAAEDGYQRALAIQERLGDEAGMALAYNNLGVVSFGRGDLEAAEMRHCRSLEIRERLGDQSGIATSLGNLGGLAAGRGEYDVAEARLRQSLEIQETLGDQAGLADSYGDLGNLAAARGDDETAETFLGRSLEISTRLGDLSGMAQRLSNLGELHAHRGDAEAAAALHVQAFAIRRRLGVPDPARDVGQLSKLRAAVGPERFAEMLASLDADGQAQLLATLDDFDSRQAGDESSPQA